MSIHHLLAVDTAALLGTAGRAPTTATTILAQSADAYALTPGRSWSLVGGLLGLVGVVVGGLALARSASRPGGAANGAVVVAVATGVAGTVIGAWVVAAAEGGPGTGYGIVGGFVSLVAGLMAVLLGGLALARSRRAA